MSPAAVLSGVHKAGRFFRRGLPLCSLFPVVGSECILQSTIWTRCNQDFLPSSRIASDSKKFPFSPRKIFTGGWWEVWSTGLGLQTPDTKWCLLHGAEEWDTTVLPALIDRTAGGRLYRACVWQLSTIFPFHSTKEWQFVNVIDICWESWKSLTAVRRIIIKASLDLYLFALYLLGGKNFNSILTVPAI